MKIPISTIRAIMKNFQSTENVMNLPGRGRVSTVYRPNARWEGEFEWPKTLQGPQLENYSWVSGPKTLKKLSNSPYITTCCSGGFQEKFSSLVQKQSPAYSVIRHDCNFKWDWLLWSDETKKMSFLAANTQDGFGEHGDKKYPHVYN